MFNFERELETRGGMIAKNPRLATYNTPNDAILVDLCRTETSYPHDSVYFCAKTGVYLSAGTENPDRLRGRSAMRPSNHFYLFAGLRDWPKEHWVKLSHEHFLDGAEAATRMKHHNHHAASISSPFRFMVKKEVELSPVRDFANWAAERMATGEWVPVPWADEEWAIKDHFCHLAITDECQVAFWPDEADAQNDIVTKMAPGRYLQAYYSDVLTPTQIRDWAVQVDVECELKIMDGADDFYHAYRGPDQGGLQSCMVYRDDQISPHTSAHWRGGMNPVRVYAAGDLAIAVLERKGKMVARAIVWPEKKVAGRIYGDVERMTAELEAQGYTLDCRSHNVDSRGKGGLNGARILKISPIAHPRNFVMPYIDYGYGVSPIEGDEAHFQLSRSPMYSAQQISGLLWPIGEEPAQLGEPVVDEDATEDDYDACAEGECSCCFSCERCGTRDDESEAWNVRTRNGTENWCEPCYDDHASTCEACNIRVSDSITISTENGDSYCRSCADDHTETCDYCDERYNNRDIQQVYDARYELDEGEEPADVADTHGDACAYCRENDDRIRADVHGLLIDTETAQSCETCNGWFSANIDENECPNAPCVAARATADTSNELEPAE
jgi:hypothetical protein